MCTCPALHDSARCSQLPLHALGAQAFSTPASTTAPGHEPGLLNAGLELLHSSAERRVDARAEFVPPSSGQAAAFKSPAEHAGPQAAPAGANSLDTEPKAASGAAAPAATAHVPNAHGILVPDWVASEAEAGTQPPPKLPTVHEGAVLSLAGPAPPRRQSRIITCAPSSTLLFGPLWEAAALHAMHHLHCMSTDDAATLNVARSCHSAGLSPSAAVKRHSAPCAGP